MRTEQIYTSTSIGWCYLPDAYPHFPWGCRVGDGAFAVPQLPGHAKRFRPLFNVGKLLDHRFLWPTLRRSPYPTGRRYRRR